MAELKKEVAEYDDFILLDIEEEYSKLPYKNRLSLLVAKERSHSQTYLGCMKNGPVFTDPKLKWYEPLSYLLGKEYSLHAYGPINALSSDVVASLVALRNNSFGMFSNEDVTIGAWMLAMNVSIIEHCVSQSVHRHLLLSGISPNVQGYAIRRQSYWNFIRKTPVRTVQLCHRTMISLIGLSLTPTFLNMKRCFGELFCSAKLILLPSIRHI